MKRALYLLPFVMLACSSSDSSAEISADTVSGDASTDSVSGDTGTTTDDTNVDADTSTDVGEPEFEPGPVPTLANPTSFVVRSPAGLAVQPSVALSSDLEALTVFTGSAEGDTTLSIWGQRNDGAPFMLHAADTIGRNEPSVCALSRGGFVALWSMDAGEAETPSLSIGFTIIGAEGPGPEQRVETERDGNHWLGHVACKDDGGFVVVGVRPESDDPSFAAFAREYDANGEPTAPAVELNDVPEATESQPVAAVTKDTVWAGWSELEGRSLARRAFETEAPVVVANEESGAVYLAGDYRVAGGALALTSAGPEVTVRWLPEGGAPTAMVPLADVGAPRHSPAITLLERPDVAAMLYQTMEGDDSRMMLELLGVDGVAPLVLSTAKLPAYVPSITYRDGVLMAAWTERDQETNFRIEVRRWDP